jgi:hypothetical protein
MRQERQATLEERDRGRAEQLDRFKKMFDYSVRGLPMARPPARPA